MRLVGTDEDLIVTPVASLLTDPAAYAAMANAVNPYGDGRAAQRAVAALAHHFGLGPAADEFEQPCAAGLRRGARRPIRQEVSARRFRHDRLRHRGRHTQRNAPKGKG